MKKILVFGDIHGRTIWRDILKKEQPDLTIFLGDYVTSHEGISSEQQKAEFMAILDYKESHPDSVVLLRGNHDMDALGYPWAACYPSAFEERAWMVPMKERYLKNTQWIYQDGDILFSHAGISEVWLKEVLKMEVLDVPAINAMKPDERFAFNGPSWDTYGEASTQPCTWIRPETLLEYAVPGFEQVVGHTNMGRCVVAGETTDGRLIHFCDALAYGAYLTIEDGNTYKYHPEN